MPRFSFSYALFLLALLLPGCWSEPCTNNNCAKSVSVATGSEVAPINQPNFRAPDSLDQPKIKSNKSKGIRLDPSYFYSSHSGQTVKEIATDVILSLKKSGVTLIYLYAYNSIYGSFYPTQYPGTIVESGYGAQNIFSALTQEAQKNDLKVVAVIPLNNFKTIWDLNPHWRSKISDNQDYKPFSNSYLLSVSHKDFKSWYLGFIDDLIKQNPNIDAVEIMEPTLDYFWSGGPDQNQQALALFAQQYPGQVVGSDRWYKFRANQFLSFLADFNQQVHSYKKETYFVQTWAINSLGALVSADIIKYNSGNDFISAGKLEGVYKFDNLVCELIWQQWFSEFGNLELNPVWTKKIGTDFVNLMRQNRVDSKLIIHVEISKFAGSYNITEPTTSEFLETIKAVSEIDSDGISVYDYEQIRSRKAFSELSHWN